MKIFFIALLGLVGFSCAHAQTFERQNMVGTWTCREVSYTEAVEQTSEGKAIVDKTKRGFTNAQFIFNMNGTFALQLPQGAPAEFQELAALNNKMWHVRAKERNVFVGSMDEDLMTIHVQEGNGFYIFLIADTPMVLKMEKTR